MFLRLYCDKERSFVKILFALVCSICISVILVGCETETPEPPPDIHALLTDAAEKMLSAPTFRLEIRQAGAPYLFTINLGEGLVQVFLRRAVGQFIAPDELYATANVIAGRLPIDIILYSKADDQWFNPSGLTWVNQPFASGFDPRRVIGEESGFRAALSSLTDLEYVGIEDFFGASVYHIRGMADGEDVSALLVGMIEFTETLPLDVYIRVDNGYPARLVITQPNTATDEAPDTQWTVDVFDVDGEKDFTPPTEG